MRDDYARPTTSVLTWLICATVAGFILQNVFWKWLGGSTGQSFDNLLALSTDGISMGFVWTLVSYSLLHDMQNLLHILVNLLMLFFFGREILALLGNKRFLWLWFGGVASGGLLWLATNFAHGGSGNAHLLGASAGVCALFMFFTALNPNRPITFLLFFVIPVTLKPKWILLVLGGLDLMGFLFTEIPGNQTVGGTAHSAHIGGYALGWLFFRFVHHREWQSPDRAAPSIELPAWLRRRKSRSQEPVYKVNLSDPAETTSGSERTTASREDLRAQVDRVLDKINSKGFGALTAAEKKLLDEAKDLLNRR
jgi:membrane associated rhomboid family serine protease